MFCIYITKIKEDILVGYNNINIFQIYFFLKKRLNGYKTLPLLKSIKTMFFFIFLSIYFYLK